MARASEWKGKPISGPVLQWQISPGFGWCGLRKSCPADRTIYYFSSGTYLLRVKGSRSCLCCSQLDEVKLICSKEACRLLAEHRFDLPKDAAIGREIITESSASSGRDGVKGEQSIEEQVGSVAGKAGVPWWEADDGFYAIERWKKRLKWLTRKKLLQRLTMDRCLREKMPRDKGRILKWLCDLFSWRWENLFAKARRTIDDGRNALRAGFPDDNPNSADSEQSSVGEDSQPCPVSVYERNGHAVASVDGVEKQVSPLTAKCLRLLIAAFPNGVDPAELNEKTSSSDARKALNALREQPIWKAVLVSPADARNNHLPHEERKWRLARPNLPSPGIP